ncbi:MAG: S8 family serine peptidase [Alphaproteobacteria bacterium]|nr:S8 family serine peptidase [Alphaproteobacteria bacterium]
MNRALFTLALLVGASTLTACDTEANDPSDAAARDDGFAYADAEIPADAQFVARRLIVRYHDDKPGLAPPASLGARALRPLRGGQAALLELPEGVSVRDAVAELRASGHYAWVEPDYVRSVQATVNDPMYSQQWGLSAVHAEDAWDQATGAGVVVAVIDTGVSTGGADGLHDVLPGYDFANGDADPDDDHGHGTHVSGTIAGASDNGVGVAGLAYEASILPVKVCSAEGWCTDSDIIDGIEYAIAEGAQVMNISLGGGPPSATMADAVWAAYDAGIFIAGASGNDYGRAVSFPAAYGAVMAVGAIDSNDTLASFSNRGQAQFLVAPGVSVVQETHDGSGNYSYESWDGTSMASPHVAAAAALLVEMGASHHQIIRTLHESAEDLGGAGRDPTYGFGRLDAGAAVQAFQASRDGSVPLTGDVDGDGLDDLVVFSAGSWAAISADGSELFSGVTFGEVGDLPFLGDLDADGDLELMLRRGTRFSGAHPEGAGIFEGMRVGFPEDDAFVADFNGDGVADLGSFARRGATWEAWSFNWDVYAHRAPWGAASSIPRVGDVDGDGAADLIVFEDYSSTWSARSLSQGELATDVAFGQPGDEVLVGDVDGDGADDLVTWTASSGSWSAARLDGAAIATRISLGQAGDVPLLGDVDGDGDADFVVYRSADASWHAVDASGAALFSGLSLGAAN